MVVVEVPKFKRWRDSVITMARKNKYAKTAFGRIRDLHKYYDSGDKALEAHADRCAPNHSIQGVAADIMKTIMAKTYAWIHRNNLENDIRILITMHDELVFEISEDKLELLVPEISKIMMLNEVIQGMLHWPIPLTVDVKYGESWRVKKKFFDDFPNAKKRLDEPLMEFQPGQIAQKVSVEPTPVEKKEEIAEDKKEEAPIAPQPVVEEKKEIIPEIPVEPEPVKPQISTGEVSIADLLADFVVPTIEASPKIAEKSKTTPVPALVDPLQSEVKPREEFDKQVLVYTLSSLKDSTRRHLNEIIIFLKKENERGDSKYQSDKKILRLRGPKGDILNVEEVKINADAFLSLARFFEL